MATPFYIDGLVLALTAALPAGSTNVTLPAGTLAANPALGLASTFAGGNYIPMTLAAASNPGLPPFEVVKITAPVTSDSGGATISPSVGSWALGDSFSNRQASAQLNPFFRRSGKLLAVSDNVPQTGNGSVLPASYSRTKAAAAKVKLGTANMRIGQGGDSTQAAAYSLGSATGAAGNRAVSPSVFLAAALNQSGMPANSDSFIGDQAFKKTNAIALGVYDTRITPGGYDGSASVLTAGGGMLANTSSVTPMVFLPTMPVDTFEVYYAVGSGLGSFKLSRTGDAANPTISQVGTSGVGKAVFTGALGNVNGLNLTWVSGGTYIIGIIAYNSAIKGIQVLNVGWSGGTTTDWTASVAGFDPLPAMQALVCDLWLWRPGINEWNQSIPVATFQAKLDLLVSTQLAISDVALCTPFPSQNTSFTLAVQQPYIDAIFAVAAKYGLAVNDTWRKVASWEQGNAFGYYANSLHPQRALYQLTAESDANFIMTLINS